MAFCLDCRTELTAGVPCPTCHPDAGLRLACGCYVCADHHPLQGLLERATGGSDQLARIITTPEPDDGSPVAEVENTLSGIKHARRVIGRPHQN